MGKLRNKKIVFQKKLNNIGTYNWKNISTKIIDRPIAALNRTKQHGGMKNAKPHYKKD